MRLYEELETGVECERLAPTLQALAQGTASSDALLELRPHLRNCAGCRATVRALHTSGLHRLTAFAPIAALIEPARAWVERLRGRSGGRGAEAPSVGELHPIEHQQDVEELMRRLNSGEPALQSAAPTVAESAGRLSTVRVNVRGWLEPALQRLQSSDLAIGVHAATTGGGGRITSIAALIGICVSGRRRGDLLRRDRAAPRSEAGDPEPGEGREAQGHREEARPPPRAGQPSGGPDPHAATDPNGPSHLTGHQAGGEASQPRADLPRPGGHPGLLVRAVRRPGTGYPGRRTIHRRRGVRAMIRRLAAVSACLIIAAIAAPSPARAGTFTVRRARRTASTIRGRCTAPTATRTRTSNARAARSSTAAPTTG